MDTVNYSIDEHIHRFAVWTASRAASRSRLKNTEIEFLIIHSKLRQQVDQLRQYIALDELYYRNWIKEIGEKICDLVKVQKWTDFKKATFHYGLAAKVISIYIKTSEVIPTKGTSLLSQVAYPPIDGILLKNFNTRYNLKLKTNWSTFEWEQYENVIDHLNKFYPSVAKWQIEEGWQVSNEEDNSGSD